MFPDTDLSSISKHWPTHSTKPNPWPKTVKIVHDQADILTI